MTASNIPNCPVCDWDGEVVWLSRVQLHGALVAQRWVCTGCNAMFGPDFQSRFPKRWMIVGLGVLTSVAVPTVFWWRHGAAAHDTA
jgi:hypothetical protein